MSILDASPTWRQLIPPSLQPFLLLSYPIQSTSLQNSSAHAPRREWAAAFHSPHTTGHRSSLSSLSNLGGASLYVHDYPSSVLAHSHAAVNASWPSTSSSSSVSSAFDSSNARPTTLYGAGPADAAFVLFCALALTVLRHVMMKYVFAAFARNHLERRDRRLVAERQAVIRGKRKLGPGKQGKEGEGVNDIPEKPMGRRKREYAVTRFSEQGWAAAYPLCTWVFGVLILTRLPAPLSPESLWATYPYHPLPGPDKLYYLGQLGWWFHQIYVINSEKRRADHWQMFAHHILTISLVVSSYLGNFTRVGIVIHTLMDLADIFLCTAKCLRYIHQTTLCDGTFVLFLVSWLLTRQIGLPYIIYTTYNHLPHYVPFKWSPSEGLFLNKATWLMFVVMQSMLLVMCTIWFTMAVRVAVRVIKGHGAEDSRSDDEDEEEGERPDEGEETWEEETEEEMGDRGIEKIPTKGEISAAPANHHTQNNHHQMESAGKALNRMVDKVACKRDTLEHEAAVRRRR